MKNKIYLDYQATTPMDRNVLDSMLPYFCEKFGNPSSEHAFGWEASEALAIAREKIAAAINVSADEIIFTSGATESNNIAIKGVAYFYRSKKNHIIISNIEHKCVIEAATQLEHEGFKISYIPVDKRGLINLGKLKEAITEQTLLVSIMAVNNEIGTVQNLGEIAKICHENNVFFHSDAAQALGKIRLDLQQTPIDLLSLSAHKVYGPKGIGALYISKKSRIRLQALYGGGGQELGIRPGTVPVPLAVGFGKAVEIADENFLVEQENIIKLYKYFIQQLDILAIDYHINNDIKYSVAHNINICFSGVDSGKLILSLPRIALSAASACASNSGMSSYVLKAIGLSDQNAKSSLRIGLGRFTTKEEIDATIEAIGKFYQKNGNI